MTVDVAIIGAGAAGLMTAIRCAEGGLSIAVFEKARKPGVKILMSGGTRCNITHDCDNRGIVEAFGKNGAFLHSPLAGFTPQDAVSFFEAEGVLTKVEDTGKVFPVSDRALDVLNALLARLKRANAVIHLGEPVTKLEDGFKLTTSLREVTAKAVVITTGGKSYPGCGTTGDGYAFAQAFGHTIVPTSPALVPLTLDIPWLLDLKGVTLPKVNLKVLEGAKVLTSRAGAMLFAHFGLTGPAPLDVSRAVSGHANPRSLTLEIDLLPEETDAALDEFLATESVRSGKQLLAGVLSQKLTRRLCDRLLAIAGLNVTRTAAALAKADRKKLVDAIKRLRLPLKGTLGFEKAEVTAGGVSLKEVDSRTMESKLKPNLFLAGEVLDLDGWIGGYNFQSAWSTGWLAGSTLVKRFTSSDAR